MDIFMAVDHHSETRAVCLTQLLKVPVRVERCMSARPTRALLANSNVSPVYHWGKELVPRSMIVCVIIIVTVVIAERPARRGIPSTQKELNQLDL